jgi:hypothetical protein
MNSCATLRAALYDLMFNQNGTDVLPKERKWVWLSSCSE